MLNAQEIATRYRRKIGIDTTWEKVENENGKRKNDPDVRRGDRPTSQQNRKERGSTSVKSARRSCSNSSLKLRRK